MGCPHRLLFDLSSLQLFWVVYRRWLTWLALQPQGVHRVGQLVQRQAQQAALVAAPLAARARVPLALALSALPEHRALRRAAHDRNCPDVAPLPVAAGPLVTTGPLMPVAQARVDRVPRTPCCQASVRLAPVAPVAQVPGLRVAALRPGRWVPRVATAQRAAAIVAVASRVLARSVSQMRAACRVVRAQSCRDAVALPVALAVALPRRPA